MASALGFILGVWLGGLAPVEYWANLERAGNFAQGFYPNMDPGVVVSLSLFLVAPIILTCFVVEGLRLVFDGQPLSIIGAVVLGLFVAAPIAYSLSLADHPLGFYAHAIVLVTQLVAFYLLRSATLKSRQARK